MRRILGSLTLAVCCAVLGSGCDPNLTAEADALQSSLRAMPGVRAVTLDYTEPVPLDSGKVLVTARMDKGSSRAELIEVVTTAYDAFRTTHHHEEADLHLRAGRIGVDVRAFRPEASRDAVAHAVERGLAATPPGGSVTIDLTTQDVARGDHVAGTYVVGLGPGSTAADVAAFLRNPPTSAGDDLIGWGAKADDGSSLTYDRGIPPEALIARWLRLQQHGVPVRVRAFRTGALFLAADAPAHLDADRPRDQRALARLAQRHLRELTGSDWGYDLYGPSGPLVAIDRYLCPSSSDGPVDDLVERWVTARFGPCPTD